MCQNNTEINAVGLGFRRSGSSWLHRLLSAQPGITKPINGLNYFSYEYHRGLNWYLDQLYTENKIAKTIELSVSYSYPENVEKVAKRILESLGVTPLFAIIRNPVDRAYSDYLRSLRMGEINDITFTDAIELYPEFTQRGFYTRLLSPFVHAVGLQSIYLIMYENLVANPEKELLKLFKFLNAQFDPHAIITNEKKLNWGKPRSRSFYSILYAIKNASDSISKSVGLYDTWSNLKLNMISPYQRLVASLSKNESMNIHTRRELTKVYRQDVSDLESTFNIKVPWRDFKE